MHRFNIYDFYCVQLSIKPNKTTISFYTLNDDDLAKRSKTFVKQFIKTLCYYANYMLLTDTKMDDNIVSCDNIEFNPRRKKCKIRLPTGSNARRFT